MFPFLQKQNSVEMQAKRESTNVTRSQKKKQQQQQQQEQPYSSDWTWLTLVTCISVTVGAVIPVGYNFGDLNAATIFIKVWFQEIVIKRYDHMLVRAEQQLLWTCFVSTFLVGGIVGALLARLLNKKFGRKGALYSSGLLQLFAVIMFFLCRTARSIEMIFLARLLTGIAGGIACVTQPMYLLEIVPLHMRGSAGSLTLVGITCGVLLGQVFTLSSVFGSNWHYALSFFIIFVLVGTLPIFWIPDSPRWIYLTSGDDERAKNALRRFRGETVNEQALEAEMTRIKSNAEGYDNESMSIREVLKTGELRLPLLIVCSYSVCQQFSGVYALFNYSIIVFAKGGMSYNSAVLANIAAGIFYFVCAILSSLVLLKAKRRPMMLASSMGCAITLIAMSLSLYFMDEVEFFKTGSIVLMVMYIIFYSLGLGPIPFFIGAEIFDIGTRAAAMSISNFLYWTCNFMVNMMFPILEETLGSFCFIPCSLFCFYCFALTFRYLPETRGRLTFELKADLAEGFKFRPK